MDPKHRQSLTIKHINPNSSKNRVNQEEQEVNPGKIRFTGGQIITTIRLVIQIVHSGLNAHRDLEIGDAVSKNESEEICFGNVVS